MLKNGQLTQMGLHFLERNNMKLSGYGGGRVLRTSRETGKNKIKIY